MPFGEIVQFPPWIVYNTFVHSMSKLCSFLHESYTTRLYTLWANCAVSSMNRIQHVCTLYEQIVQFPPWIVYNTFVHSMSKLCSFLHESYTSRLYPLWANCAVSSMNRIHHVCTLYEQIVEFLFVNAGVMNSILFWAFCTVHLFNLWNENQLMSLFYSYIAGSLHVSGPQAHLQERSYSCSHNHWFRVCTALVTCSVCCGRSCYSALVLGVVIFLPQASLSEIKVTSPSYYVTPTKIVINYEDTGGVQRKNLFWY